MFSPEEYEKSQRGIRKTLCEGMFFCLSARLVSFWESHMEK